MSIKKKRRNISPERQRLIVVNVPTLLVAFFFALVFLCTLCPCISVNRINTRRLVISIQHVLRYSLSYVFIIKVQNIYYGSYREAFCVLADIIMHIDYVPNCVRIVLRVGRYDDMGNCI